MLYRAEAAFALDNKPSQINLRTIHRVAPNQKQNKSNIL